MLRLLLALFLLLHGLVHLLYLGQSARLFELQPGMTWPDGAWTFASRLGNDATRRLAVVALAVAAAGFAVGGAALLLGYGWWRPIVMAAAVVSSMLYLLMWDGAPRDLADKGAVGILINLAILVVILGATWSLIT